MKKVNNYLQPTSLILILVGIIAFVIRQIARRSARFAELITNSLGYVFRVIGAKISSLLPFSIAELLIIASPIVLVIIILIASKKVGKAARMRFLASFLAGVTVFYTVYVFTLGIGYHRTSLASRMKLDDVQVTRDNLYSTMMLMQSECEKLLSEIEFDENGSSVNPISFDETCDEIIKAYGELDSEYPDLKIKNFDSTAKPVRFSNVMTAFEILGVYTFFTGESNVNVHYPDFTEPFTIAHELAHQRGISRENEANFIAFLVCARSANAYTRYSAYMNMYTYLASALGKTDKDLLRDAYKILDDRLYGELVAYSNFCNDNKVELTAWLSDFFNDNYLKAQGTEGVVSYGLVVRLCISYYSELCN